MARHPYKIVGDDPDGHAMPTAHGIKQLEKFSLSGHIQR
jgi:hypothetical protein